MGKNKHTEKVVTVTEEIQELAEEIAAENQEGQSEQEQTVEGVTDSEVIAELAAEVSEEVAHETAEEEKDASETAEETEESSEQSTEPSAKEAEETGESTEAPTEEPVRRKKRGWLVALIILGGLVLLTVGVYLGFAQHYEDRFFMKTSVNGTACAGMTVEEVEAIMQEQVEQYVLTVTARNDIIEEIKGSDIGIKFNGVNVIQDAFAEQNPYLWFTGLYEEVDIKAEIDFTYDEEKLNKVIGELICLKEENQQEPVSAKPIYQNGTYGIQEETYGSKLDVEKMKNVIHTSVANIENSVDLDEKECYVAPTYTKDSKEVIAARDALNQCLKTDITYSLADITEHVNANTVLQWISVDDAMNLVINEEGVRAFANTLGSKYNTPDSMDQITSPTGKTANVSGGRLGRIVNAAAECNQLIEEIKAGTQTTREPILSQNATPDGVKSWGNTYIEVDISEQHMWYIVDGTVQFESDVVTGSPGRDTPAGKFQILEKLSPKTLRGNIMPNGQPEYVTPVKYWARVTWSGVGFHDATWQAEFGGTRYKDGYGSHGCINMPYGKIAELYGMINKGTAVVIHY